MESYRTLAGRGTGRFEEKKSEFLGFALPVGSEEEALAFLEEVRGEHRTARHHVYAYVLRQGHRERYSDDGEPAQTAGLPALRVLQHKKLTDGMVVVVRYFGGTLLGTGGLVRAYTAATQAALDAAGTKTFRSCVRLSVRLPYPAFEPARQIFQLAQARLEEPQFTDDVCLTAVLPADKRADVEHRLQELCRGKAAIRVEGPFFDAL